jgi:trehalose 6-phosphate phosphatase
MSPRPDAIEALAENPPSSGLILDFDGVLAPIVEDPTTSAMPDGVAAVLGRLAGKLGLLAVMSGRPAEFLADRVPVAGVPLLGSYGIEQFQDGVIQVAPGAREWLGAVDEASRALSESLAGSPGIRIERKSVSVAVHWRQAPDHAAAETEVRRVAERVAADTGLRPEPGKLVEELRPPIDVDKGSAVLDLIGSENLSVIAYVGDDLGDIPALEAMREATDFRGYALVVDHGPETAQKVRDSANQTFAGTEAFAAWLADLATKIGV